MHYITVTRDEDGFWIAECPSLPGCIGEGLTRSYAIAVLLEVMQEHLLALQEEGLPPPEPTDRN